jgi:hypothetical protein
MERVDVWCGPECHVVGLWVDVTSRHPVAIVQTWMTVNKVQLIQHLPVFASSGSVAKQTTSGSVSQLICFTKAKVNFAITFKKGKLKYFLSTLVITITKRYLKNQ